MLEVLASSSHACREVMQSYADFFATVFGNELVGFGYENLRKNGFYEAISNQPKIAEIFVDTKAYQVIQNVTKQLCFVEHGFVYPDKSFEHTIYNKFRTQLDKELGMYATFYTMENCLNYQRVFSWNFRSPLKPISLTKWENEILLCFINNRRSIQYVLEKFKKNYFQTIRKQITLVKILEPIIEEKEIRSTRMLEENLLKSNLLTINDLYLKNVNLSPKEALCAYFYLQGMSAKEIAGKMYVSRRTVEDYIKCIKQKLSVKSRSEFHSAVERMNLWRSIL